MVGCTYSSGFGTCVSLPRKSPAHGASALHVSVDGHDVSGLQHNQNDLLIAYFAPYRWLRFTGVINEKSHVSRRRRGLTGEMNEVYCLRSLSLASHALSGFPATMAGAVFTFDINNVQRNAWFTPQVLSLSRATTTGFPDVSMTPTVGTPFLISKNGLLLPEHSWLSLYSSICAFPVFRLSTETV